MRDRIKAIRRHPKFCLSQEAFGAKIGVTGAAISRMESGVNNPSEQVILSICREYGVREAWLRTGEGEMFVEAADDSLLSIVREYNLDSDDYYVLSEFVQLPPAERRAVISYMRRVVSRIDGMKPEDARSAEAKDRPRYPQDMTREEYHRELDRQLDEEERQGESALASGS